MRHSYSEKADCEQRILALDPNQSFIIQAPAGSGKTELLIQRFLVLLTTVRMPEEILAMTFTRKAAYEMKRRVMDALGRVAGGTEVKPSSFYQAKTVLLAQQVLDRDRQYGWQLLMTPSRLRIQTIDSLCAELVQACPLSSQCHPSYIIANQPLSLYQDAIHHLLVSLGQNHDSSNPLAIILAHLHNDIEKLEDLLIYLLSIRDQWLPYIQDHQEDQVAKIQLEHQLLWVVSEALNRLTALFPKILVDPLLSVLHFASANCVRENKVTPLNINLTLQQLPMIPLPPSLKILKTDRKQYETLRAACIQSQAVWQSIATLLITQTGEWRRVVNRSLGFPALSETKNSAQKALLTDYKQQFKALIIELQSDLILKEGLYQIKALPTPYYPSTSWSLLTALFSLLKQACQQLHRTFKKYAQVDYIEQVQSSLSVLRKYQDHKERELALGYFWRHILIDEFQDTSMTQYQLFKQLIQSFRVEEGHSLFIVGDPMQSIYRFRQAEVGLFMRLYQEGLPNISLIPLRLSVNFRSSAAIVHWVNQHFSKIFPTKPDIVQGAVRYSPSVACDTLPIHSEPVIKIKGFKTQAMHQQAEYIVDLIKELKQGASHDRIAILIRSRRHLACIIPALKAASLTWQAIELDQLAQRQAIQDVLALTCALLHLSDRVAWLAVLRAPWCGLFLADLCILAEDPQTIILERLTQMEIQHRLSEDAKQRLSSCLAILQNSVANRARYPLRAFVEKTWLQLGGAAYYATAADQQDLACFFELLTELQQDTPMVTGEQLKNTINSLFVSEKQQDPQLQIMTIHAAKGLEFDTVIIPHLECTLPNHRQPLLAFMEYPLTQQQDSALLLAALPKSNPATGDELRLYHYIHHHIKQKLYYEEDRLWYVAVTRAKKRLYLCFNIGDHPTEAVSIANHTFLKKLWPLLQSDVKTILTEDQPFLVKEAEEPSSLFQPRLLKRLPITALRTHYPHRICDPQYAQHIRVLMQGTHDSEKEIRRVIGILVHQILRQIALYGFVWWQRYSIDQQMDYIKRHGLQKGLSTPDITQSSCLVWQYIQQTLDDQRGRWILSPHAAAETELSLTTLEDQGIGYSPKVLVIDRTFIDEKQNRWIIDYKTASLPEGMDIPYFLQQQYVQYHAKMQSYQRAIQQLDPQHSIKLGLYFPALPAWYECDRHESISHLSIQE